MHPPGNKLVRLIEVVCSELFAASVTSTTLARVNGIHPSVDPFDGPPRRRPFTDATDYSFVERPKELETVATDARRAHHLPLLRNARLHLLHLATYRGIFVHPRLGIGGNVWNYSKRSRRCEQLHYDAFSERQVSAHTHTRTQGVVCMSF